VLQQALSVVSGSTRTSAPAWAAWTATASSSGRGTSSRALAGTLVAALPPCAAHGLRMHRRCCRCAAVGPPQPGRADRGPSIATVAAAPVQWPAVLLLALGSCAAWVSGAGACVPRLQAPGLGDAARTKPRRQTANHCSRVHSQEVQRAEGPSVRSRAAIAATTPALTPSTAHGASAVRI
jgi:hypothetical protein